MSCLTAASRGKIISRYVFHAANLIIYAVRLVMPNSCATVSACLLMKRQLFLTIHLTRRMPPDECTPPRSFWIIRLKLMA